MHAAISARAVRLALFFFCGAFGFAACGGPAEPADIDGDRVAQALTSSWTPRDVPTRRMYFGIANTLVATGDTPYVYGIFDLSPAARVRVEVRAVGEPAPDDDDIGFKLYRVRADGSMVLLGVIDGSRRRAAATLHTGAGGTFVVEAILDDGEVGRVLELSCARPDGRCAPRHQPGEMCGGFAGFGCDEGLTCIFADGQCFVDDGAGTCELAGDFCTADCPQVCGCDGKTYCNRCEAARVGVSLQSEGACPCDENVFTTPKGDEGPFDVVGTWTFVGPRGADDVHATLTLAGGCDVGVVDCRPAFVYEAVLDPQCLHAMPACRRASRMLRMEGVYEVQGSNVQLLPRGAAPPEMAQSFGIEESCAGALRLTTTELDLYEIFTRATTR